MSFLLVVGVFLYGSMDSITLVQAKQLNDIGWLAKTFFRHPWSPEDDVVQFSTNYLQNQ